MQRPIFILLCVLSIMAARAAAPDGPRICRTWLQYSDDDGVTWTKPRE